MRFDNINDNDKWLTFSTLCYNATQKGVASKTPLFCLKFITASLPFHCTTVAKFMYGFCFKWCFAELRLGSQSIWMRISTRNNELWFNSTQIFSTPCRSLIWFYVITLLIFCSSFNQNIFEFCSSSVPLPF